MPEFLPRQVARVVLIGGAALIAGCAVGPKVQAPEPALPEAFANAPSDPTAGSIAVAELWTSLGDETLSELVDRAASENLSVRQALAVFSETRALSNLAVYSLVPTFSIGAEQERIRESGQDPFAFGSGVLVERFRAGFDAAWEIDLFGSLRRQSERIEYLEEADAATLYAVRVAVIAEVAQAYFEWRGESLRRDLLRRNIELQSERLDILEASLEAGRGTAFDVARARAEERRLAASLPPLGAGVDRALQRLAVLTRLAPAELKERLAAPGSMPELPPMIAVGRPADWLLRRPDVLAAERRMAAATAAVGIEVAEYFPRISLIGDFGWTGSSSSVVGDGNAERWRVAPGLSWRLLDFGRIGQRVDAAEARLRGAYAAYEETWRLALEETENALSAYRAATERAATLTEAVTAAVEASELATLRFNAGADSYLSVIDADRSRTALEDELAFAMTERATALAALYKALGGDFARRAMD